MTGIECTRPGLERDTTPDHSTGERARLLLGLVALLLVVGSLFQLSSRPLFDPDEGRNAETMREMAESNDFLVPRLNGLPFLDKPFMYFAAGGLSIELLGASELAVRLPALLCTLVTVLLVGLFARRWLGSSGGPAAALAYGMAPLVLAYTQIVIFDAMLTLWITAAVLAFHHAVETEPHETRIPWSHLAWAAIALGVLTKGPVAVLVPLVAVAPWALWRRRGSRLWRHGSPLVLVLLVAPWVWAVLRLDPRFLHYVVFTETLGRLSGDELNRNAPVWYYLPVLLVGALPWSLVPFAGWRDLRDAWRRREPTVLFLLSWLVVPFVLFSVMSSKRPHYLLPLLPALALLGIWIWSRRQPGESLPGARAGAVAWLVLGLGTMALGWGAAPGLQRTFERFGSGTVTSTLLGLGTAWAVAGLLAWGGRRSPPIALLGFALPMTAVLVLGTPIAAAVGEERSALTAARAVEAAGPPGVEVIAIDTCPPSLGFYLGRTFTLVSRDANPMRSNYILRRYENLVGRDRTLRSPAWLTAALADCRTRRLFLVDQRHTNTHAVLEGHGSPLLWESTRLRLYGGCAAAGRPSDAPVAQGATTPLPG